MKRIIYHWTAGTLTANSTDKLHYHYLINGKGEVIDGIFKVSANEVCRTDAKGKALYAAHTGGGNTSSIGIAFCGMYNFHSRTDTGGYLLTSKQIEKGFELGAKLVKEYKLNINDSMTIQTHYGFGKRNPKTASAGKIDIVYLPSYPDVKQEEVEKFIYNKVKWYYKKLYE